MIEANNNDYGLETIQVFSADPFAVGHTLPGRAAFRDWLVHRRDATTLLIAPIDKPDDWRPAHIYSQGGTEGR